MKPLFTGLICLAIAMGSPLAAQDKEKAKGKQKKNESQTQAKENSRNQEAIRGTVAGVTTIGEAVIDPLTNTAVIAEADYLTVLGTPVRQQNPRRDRANRENNDSQNRATDRSQQDRGQNQRQNLYLVAVTPETKVQVGNRQGRENQEKATDQAESRSDFEGLEIGDRVMVQFSKTERLHARSDSDSEKTAANDKNAKDEKTEKRVAGFRGDPRSKHGRNRIFVGKASQIRIMAEPMNQNRQNRNRNNSDRNEASDRNKKSDRNEAKSE